jgi:hypothetical protein
MHVVDVQNERIANGRANRVITFDSIVIKYRGLVNNAQAIHAEAGHPFDVKRPASSYPRSSPCVPVHPQIGTHGVSFSVNLMKPRG